MIQQWFCRHKWETLSSKEVASYIDKALEVTKTLVPGQTLSPWMFEQKRVLIVTCPRCGALRKFVDTF